MAESSQHESRERHLVILVHGFQASAGLLAPLGRAFQARGAAVHICSCNSALLHTWDGIEAGGSRVAEEVRGLLPGRSRVTFVGHSLGGLYTRYALHKLQGELASASVDVCTIASPHKGASVAFATVTGRMLGRTVRELTLMDGGHQEPMLHRLAREPMIDALRKCTKVTFVGNLNRDFNVPGDTALAVHNDHLVGAPRGFQRIDMPPMAIDPDSAWVALEGLHNLQRFGMLWPAYVPASHDIIAGHYGPLHFLRPSGIAEEGTLAGKIVDIVMAADSRL
eukprot:TRINITY_DN23593_c1_g1_i2.p1 TRINITY_DN23593_c1_g1~~TRINITY_DN23593_c1_g1_i2.p1  ORF type:complete len:280 (-),score=25.29 TRINITY_DN23593_c1_g1_i2:212-1051(-)